MQRDSCHLAPLSLMSAMPFSHYHRRSSLLGRHLRGKISLGMQYASGTAAKPKPISIWAPITRYMLSAPGAIAEPTNEMAHVDTRMIFRAWKVSDAEAMTGPRTAWTSDSALVIQVSVALLFRSSPMKES